MNARGLALVELLVASAIAGILMVALVGHVRAARNAQLAGETAHDTAAALQLATELLREELNRAGSGPWPLPMADEVGQLAPSESPEQFLSRGLRVASATGGHALTLVYIDDGLTTQTVARHLTFEAGQDGQGEPQLYRRSGTSPRQPWVAGIERMEVAGFLDAEGESVGLHQAAGRRVRALWLELHANGEQRNALLELPHLPQVTGP